MRGEKRNLFVAFRSAYHGDTAGAAALGAAKMFSIDHEGWRFPVRAVVSIEELEKLSRGPSDEIAAVVIEPMIQGAAGMRIWPAGTSAAVRKGRALDSGQSDTVNAVGCGAGRRSCGSRGEENVLDKLRAKSQELDSQLRPLRELSGVTEVRQCGFVVGIEMDDVETANEV